MITFEVKNRQFHFASPPRTGSTWFVNACYEVGLKETSKANVHIPFPKDYSRVEHCTSIIRHPYDWMVSYYYVIKGGKIGIEPVDRFAHLAKYTQDHYEFIQLYLEECPGAIGEMFACYQSSTVMKLEDMPWAAMDFLDLYKLKTEKLREFNPINARKAGLEKYDKKLTRHYKSLLVEAENDFCERYDYI